MNTLAIIILSVITFIIVIGFVIMILILALKDNTPTYSNTIQSTSGDWSENKRGYTSYTFAPCLESSNEAKKIYSILKSYNLDIKYMKLFNVYSIVLCQYNQLQSNSCEKTFLNERLMDLKTYSGNPNGQNAMTIVKAITDLRNTKMGQFLVMATDLIEKYIANIKGETIISNIDKEQIIGYNSFIYRQKYDAMNRKCQI